MFVAVGLFPEAKPTSLFIDWTRLLTGELLISRQFIGYDDIGTILLKHPEMQAEDVMCCYVFVRSWDGKKASDSVYVDIYSVMWKISMRLRKHEKIKYINLYRLNVKLI